MKPMNVEYLMMDASILLPPTGTPLTGIDFVKRLPCGDVEKTRRVSERWTPAGVGRDEAPTGSRALHPTSSDSG